MRDMTRFVWMVSLVLWMNGHARAQPGVQKVLELNRQAIAAYTNLDLETAGRKLEEALEVARQSHVVGAPLARTLINLGVVYIGGFRDNAQGLHYFIRALEADPAVQLDPLVSTPEIQTVFTLAKSRVGKDGSASPPTPPPQGGGGGKGAAAAGGAGASRLGTIPHIPVPEQLTQTAVPVFIEVPDDSGIARVNIYYRGVGMREYQEAEMEPLTGGYGFEIPCEVVFEPKVEYFLIAYDEKGDTAGNVGDAEDPVEVKIVAQRSHPPPSLPDRIPPVQCTDEECPPGMPGCLEKTVGDVGDPCTTSEECRGTFVCVEGLCTSEYIDDPNADVDVDKERGPPRFFAHIGFTVGVGYAKKGMASDTAPPTGDMSGNFIPSGMGDCKLDNPNEFCVRLATAGLLPTLALRTAIGYYITPRIGVAFTFRYQPDAGRGSLAHFLIGGRLQYLLTEPVDKGFNAAAFVGAGGGQIQLHPHQTVKPEPYIISGLTSAQIGFVFGYRFTRGIGLVFTPEADFLFPTFLFNIDLMAGLEFAI